MFTEGLMKQIQTFSNQLQNNVTQITSLKKSLLKIDDQELKSERTPEIEDRSILNQNESPKSRPIQEKSFRSNGHY